VLPRHVKGRSGTVVVAPWETPPAHAARVCPVSGVREKEVAPGCLPSLYPSDTNS